MSYPLPQSGEIEPTDEVCEHCGAPKVIITTRRGPWKVCIDPACPGKPKQKPDAGRGRPAGKTAAKRSPSRVRKAKKE